MRPALRLPQLSPAAFLLVLCLAWAPRVAGQSSGAEAPPPPPDSSAAIQALPPPGGGEGDTVAPSVLFAPSSGTLTAPTQTIRIEWCDDQALNSGSRQVTWRGATVSAPYTPSGMFGCGAHAYSDVVVQPVAGQNTLWARICDGAGNCQSNTATFSYGNTPPTAVFSASPNPAAAGATVTLNGSASHDAESAQLTHAWEWQDESGIWSRSAAGPTVQTSWSREGTYEVRLRVTDGGGLTHEGTATVTINPPPPLPDATVTLSPPQGSWSGTAATHQAAFEVTWCRPDAPLGQLVVKLNGAAVSHAVHPFTPTAECAGHARSTMTLTLPPGTHTLRAEHLVNGVVKGYAQGSYTYSRPAVPAPTVTPSPASVSVMSGTAQHARFLIGNPSQAEATYTLSAACSWGAACAPSWSSVVVQPGGSVEVTVSYTAPAPGSATVSVTGSTWSSSATGTMTLSASPPPTPEATVTISPAGGSWSGTGPTHTVAGVTIRWCRPTALADMVVRLNGNTVHHAVSRSTGTTECPGLAHSTLDLTLGSATHTLLAEHRESGALKGSAQATFVYAQVPDAQVTPLEPTVSGAAGSAGVSAFRVVNTGLVLATWSLAAGCTGATGCAASRTSVVLAPGAEETVSVTYTVPASGTGQVRLTASFGSVSRTGTVNLTSFVPGVRVSPDVGTVTVAGNTSQVARFRVVNTGPGATTYAFSGSCTGGAECAPSSGGTTVRIAHQDSARVEVPYQSPVSGTGQVRLTATAGSASSQGTVNVVSTAPPTVGFPGDSLSLTRIERSACVTVALGPAAASECGDLRIVHALPSVRVLNQVRTPYLFYNHEHAVPRPIVAEHLTTPSGTPPDSIHAVLMVAGRSYTGKWAGWSSPTTRRIAVSVTDAFFATGVYAYTFEVTARWNSGAVQTLRTRGGQMVVVNRSASPFGAGWWLAGVEQLHHVGDTLKLWVGGDGSARLYRGAGPAGPWVADGFDRPQTLVRRDSAGIIQYVRPLPGGAEVRFNSLGEHVATVSRLRHVTSFTWQSFATGRRRLVALTLPSATGAPEALSYTFGYQNNTSSTVPRLNVVEAPAAAGDPRRTDFVTDVYGRIVEIVDPDRRSVHLTYNGNLFYERTDRQGGRTRFLYSRNKVHSAFRFVAGDSLRTVVEAMHGLGLNGISFREDSVQVTLDGPRTDVSDLVRWHLNRWGAPVRVRDPFGAITRISYGDARWPARVTQVIAPNGLPSTAAYDERGNLASRTEWHSYGDGRHATTSYAWHPTWDAITRVVLPEGETTTFEYDGYGHRTAERPAGDAARQVRFDYLPVNHATAPGLLARVVSPLSGRDTVEYDARGNLSASVDATGARTMYWADRIGRDTLVDAPGYGSVRLRSRTVYDAMDRDSLSVTFGDSQEGNLHVASVYDAEGRLKSVRRWSDPDRAQVKAVERFWMYDDAGRLTMEYGEGNGPRSLRLDRAGNAVHTYTPRGDTIFTEFDAMNRPVRRIVPRAEYDQATWATRTWLKSGEFVIRRDTLPSPRYAGPSGKFVIPRDTTVYRYHPQTGLMIAADGRDARVRRGYYPNGQLRADTLQIRTWADVGQGGNFVTHEYVLEYTYDRNGRRSTMTLPANVAPRGGGAVPYRVQQYGYDRATGALSYLRNVLGQEYRFFYDLEGRAERVEHPGQRTETYTYGAGGRMSQRKMVGANFHPTAAHAVLDAFEVYRDDGRVARVSGGGAEVHATYEFQYTGLGRLRKSTRSISGSMGDAGPFLGEDYKWDALGNRIEDLQSYLHSGSIPTVNRYRLGTNRIEMAGPPDGQGNTGVPIDHMFYDAAGNLFYVSSNTRKCNSHNCGTGTYDHRITLSYYGADDRLRGTSTARCQISFDNESSTPPVCAGLAAQNNATAGAEEWYRYDPLGRRILVRTMREHSCTNAQDCTSEVTRYVWDGDQILFEIRAPGGLYAGDLENDRPTGTEFGSVLYTHGPKLDQPLDIIRMGSYLHSPWGDAYPVHPIADWRGNFIDGADWNGKRLPCGSGIPCLINWPTYSAFRGRTPATQTTFFGSLVFGKEDASGFTYMRNRYYNPQTGSFTQTDPIGLAGGLNSYGFGNGDPVTFSDPYGLSADSTGLLARAGRAGRWLADRASQVPVVRSLPYVRTAANVEVAAQHVERAAASNNEFWEHASNPSDDPAWEERFHELRQQRGRDVAQAGASMGKAGTTAMVDANSAATNANSAVRSDWTPLRAAYEAAKERVRGFLQ